MREPKAVGQALLDVCARHMPPEVLQFVRQGVPMMDVEQGSRPGESKQFQRSLFFGYFAGVGRRTRELGFSLTPSERSQLVAAGVTVPEAWSLACTARVALLAFACAALEAREHHGLLKEAYAKGDNGERIAVLRGLSLLPDPRRFVDIATEACRTHVQDVFEAICCDNPYAERYFPDQSYNQLVIKALFTEVPLSRVQGLVARKNPDLYRMARDYEDERRAASRTVSADLTYVAHALENES